MMSRKVRVEAPSFARTPVNVVQLSYDIELITPMAGGGVESWKPDKNNPARSQAIKGQLRSWWRTMQPDSTSEVLKANEGTLWGSTASCSSVSLNITIKREVTAADLLTIPRNDNGYLQYDDIEVPGYVLFPFQHADDPCQLIKNLSFRLTVRCPTSEQVMVENTVRLWILFGGLGARNTRGCGSLYCPQVMADFPHGEAIKQFLNTISPDDPPARSTASWPMIGNSRFGFDGDAANDMPSTLWCNYLNRYRDFRQGNIAREPRPGPVPGRSRWPEPDAIRDITGVHGSHAPRHSDRWFPRTAYGLPVLSRFNTRRDPTDPQGDFNLQPRDSLRWPSPIILKVIKLSSGEAARIWLLLNHVIPDLNLTSTNYNLTSRTNPEYQVPATEHPDAFSGKQLLHGLATPATGISPYDALINHLNVPEVP